MFFLKNQKLANIKFLRIMILPILKLFNTEIKITHHYSFKRFHLMLWDHKGYWFYGKDRENSEMVFLNKIIEKDFSILEIGAHIGYLTSFFEYKTDSSKSKNKVVVAEPSEKNIYFLKKNISPNTQILKKAFSDKEDLEVDFFVDSFGGFTNSILKDFTTGFTEIHFNKNQFVNTKGIEKIKVLTETVDNYCKENNFEPDFIKIDAEGAEINILKGSLETIKHVKCMMIEASRDKKEIYEILDKNFNLYSSHFKKIKSVNDMNHNIFCLSKKYYTKEL